MAHPPIYGQFLQVPETSYIQRGPSNRELGADELAAILEELQPKSNVILPLSQRYQTLHSTTWHPYIISPSLSSRASDSSSSDLSCPSSSSLAPSEPPTSFYKRWGNQKTKKSAQHAPPRRKSPICKLSPVTLAKILEHLRPTHDGQDPEGDIKDLLNAAISCRDLYKACQIVLYHQLDFKLADIEIFKKKILSKKGTKLELLLRSFRKNEELGQHVRHIRCDASESETATELPQASEYALISFLGQCSNLESITGLPIPYIDSKSELHHTLSSLSGLQQLQCIGQSQLIPSEYDLPKSPFSSLRTLAVLSPGFTTTSEALRFSMSVRRLPALKYLLLKDFSRVFTDSHFRMLPLQKLQALRLENVEGLSDDGLDASFSGLRDSNTLIDLSLIESGLRNMSTVSAILDGATKLRRLTVMESQIFASGELSRKNFVRSDSLRQIHWQIRDTESSENAYKLLANSIAANCMPSLLTVRVPYDFSGIIQAVCRPLAPPTMNSRVQPSGNQIPQSITGMGMAYSRRAAMARAAKALAPFRRQWIDEIGGEWDIIQNLGEGRFFSEEHFDMDSSTLGYIRITVSDEDGRVVTMTDRPKFLGRVHPHSNETSNNIPDYLLFGDGENDTAICSVDTWIQRRLL